MAKKATKKALLEESTVRSWARHAGVKLNESYMQELYKEEKDEDEAPEDEAPGASFDDVPPESEPVVTSEPPVSDDMGDLEGAPEAAGEIEEATAEQLVDALAAAIQDTLGIEVSRVGAEEAPVDDMGDDFGGGELPPMDDVPAEEPPAPEGELPPADDDEEDPDEKIVQEAFKRVIAKLRSQTK